MEQNISPKKVASLKCATRKGLSIKDNVLSLCHYIISIISYLLYIINISILNF